MYKKYKMLSVLALSLFLVACGGGGGPTVDNSKAIQQAADNIGNKLPDTKPTYSGGFFAVDGNATGWIAGTSEEKIVSSMAAAIVSKPSDFPTFYKALLSDAGLDITAYGAQVGTGSVSGLPLMAPDHVYNFKLKADGTLAVTVTVKG